MCTSYRLYKKKNGLLVYGPCKVCEECRNTRREEYTQRLMHEWETYGYIGSFVTLTYRDDDLVRLYPEGSAVLGDIFKGVRPVFDSVVYRPDCTSFTDKLQKRLKRKYGKSCRYVIAAEYGDEEKRPHYHGIILGLPISERKMVLECWNKGNIKIDPITKTDIRYTLKYIDKQVFGASAIYNAYGDFEPPFMHFSKGLGFKWIENNIDKFDKFGNYKISDKKNYQLSPYMINKFRFEHKPQTEELHYPDSVIKYAVDNHISDLETAAEQKSRLKKQSLEHKDIRFSGGRIDYSKVEKELAKEKLYNYCQTTEHIL